MSGMRSTVRLRKSCIRSHHRPASQVEGWSEQHRLLHQYIFGLAGSTSFNSTDDAHFALSGAWNRPADRHPVAERHGASAGTRGRHRRRRANFFPPGLGKEALDEAVDHSSRVKAVGSHPTAAPGKIPKTYPPSDLAMPAQSGMPHLYHRSRSTRARRKWRKRFSMPSTTRRRSLRQTRRRTAATRRTRADKVGILTRPMSLGKNLQTVYQPQKRSSMNNPGLRRVVRGRWQPPSGSSSPPERNVAQYQPLVPSGAPHHPIRTSAGSRWDATEVRRSIAGATRRETTFASNQFLPSFLPCTQLPSAPQSFRLVAGIVITITGAKSRSCNILLRLRESQPQPIVLPVM